MREIKFRAWDTEAKQMILVNDAKFVDGVMIGAKGVNWDNQVVVMQFTGLLDKNGKEIYEGDIVETEDVGMCEVEWIGSGLSLHTFPRYSSRSIFSIEYRECEVIGNIYENPELIQKDD